MALELDDFLPWYPASEDPHLQATLYTKRELYDLRVGKKDPPIARDGSQKLNSQLLIERLFSDYTPFDEVLVYHEMGTGKSCAAFTLSEVLKHRKTFRQCVVLARGDDSLDNLRRELIQCSTTYKIGTEFRTMEEEMRKIRRVLKDFYTFRTYHTFAKEISSLSDEALEARWNKSIFIVDEGHNIHTSDPDETNLIYSQLFRCFHHLSLRKILILTGTPMRDDVAEIASLMNLLLPAEKQLPVGADFTRAFLVEQKDGTYKVREDRVELLKEYLRARVSYMSSALTDVPILYLGAPNGVPDIPQFRSVDLQMSPHQTKGYAAAFDRDASGDRRSIFTNSVQASLCVFPDGSWGVEGAQAFMNKDGSLIETFQRDVQRRLRDFSAKYDFVVRTLRDPRNERKNTYIYCSLVNGSGAKLLASILEAHGFMPCQGIETGKASRYLLLTSGTSHITRRIAYFNRPENCYGEYCRVIIGSRKIAEGFSFKNIQIELLLTLHWNETETLQAARRGARFGSWNALLQRPDPVVLSISKVCAIPAHDPITSIDKRMLEFSKRKDVSIKRMDRVLKEVAIDCPLMYERNVHIESGDYSRECDYDVCRYQCDSGDAHASDGGADISTYELYYGSFVDLLEPLAKLFGAREQLSFELLQELIRPTDPLQLLKALAYLIENNIPILNRYGRSMYLRESFDTYYLDPNIVAPATPFSAGYPVFKRTFTMDDALEKLKANQLAEQLAADTSLEVLVGELPDGALDTLIRLAIREQVQGRSSARVQEVLDRFKDTYTLQPQNEEALAIFTAHDKSATWCLNKAGEWTPCVVPPQAEEEAENPYGYEGILGRHGAFCIKKLGQAKKRDRRTHTTGAVCIEAGYKKGQLIDMIRELNVPHEEEALEQSTKKELCAMLQEWFAEKGILRQGECGTARKRKNS